MTQSVEVVPPADAVLPAHLSCRRTKVHCRGGDADTLFGACRSLSLWGIVLGIFMRPNWQISSVTEILVNFLSGVESLLSAQHQQASLQSKVFGLSSFPSLPHHSAISWDAETVSVTPRCHGPAISHQRVERYGHSRPPTGLKSGSADICVAVLLLLLWRSWHGNAGLMPL